MNSLSPSVKISTRLKANPKKVWHYLTNLEAMHTWYFEEITEFSPIVGFSTSFDIVNNGIVFKHQWKIIESLPHQTLSYEWNYDGYQGNSILIFRIFSRNSSTILDLEHRVIEDFIPNIPEFSHENCMKGWQYFMSRLQSCFE